MKNILIIVLIFFMQKAVAQTSAFATIDSLLQKGRYKIALQKLQEIQPPTFQSNIQKASIYHLIDNYQKSILFYKKALEIKEDATVKLKLAKEYQRLKKYQKAIVIYENLVEKDAKNLVLQYQLAKLYLIVYQPKKAVEKFQFLIKKDSENANYSYQLGIAYALLGKRNLKIDSYLDAYRKDNQHLKAVYHLATSFKVIGDLDSSYLFVEKGLKINSNHLKLNKLKINKLYREKKYKQAILLLKNINSLAKNDYYTIKMLGRSYYNIDSLELAKTYFRKARKLDSDDFKNLTYLGHIAMKQKKYGRARINYIIATFTGKQKRDEEYYGLASVYIRQEKRKEAIETLKKAMQENRRNYKALYQLAFLSDGFYKDKKIAYKLYQKYINSFEKKDKEMTVFVLQRIKEIKKTHFLKGEIID